MKIKIPRLDAIEDDVFDKLGFKIGAQRLANTLNEIETPNCLGIYGVWGSGKTSLMKLTKKYIASTEAYKNDIATVWFDPWKYELEKNVPVVYPLLRQIQKEFRDNKFSKNNFKKKIKLGAFITFSLYGSFAGILKNIFGWKSGIDDLQFPTVKTITEEVNASQNLLYSEYEKWIDNVDDFKEEFRIKLRQSLQNSGKKKLYIFIDDMDRCSQENAIQLLEILKNYLNVENVLFIIGVDHTVLKEYIDQKYSRNENSDFGRLYISKIIPMSLTLPSKDPLLLVQEILNSNKNLAEDMIGLMAKYLELYCHSNRRLMIIIVYKFLLVISFIDIDKFHSEVKQIFHSIVPNPYRDIRCCYMVIFRWCILKELIPDFTSKYDWHSTFIKLINSTDANLVKKISQGYREDFPRELVPPLDRESVQLVNSYVEDGLFKEA
jgi:hypothetical protein